MSWYDVYENVDVQRITRSKAAGVTGLVAVVLLVGVIPITLGLEGTIPLWVAVPFALGIWTAYAAWWIRRLEQLRRVVWCVKISREEIAGYDYARRRIIIPWPDVERVEIGESDLTIYGPPATSLEITHLFEDFPEVSHRVIENARRHDLPVFVNGKPWQQLDVYEVFPFLSSDASSPQPGSTTA
ncbi:MAG: hypothetical protein WD021_06135 [Rhodothermales bacterium]